MDAYPLGFVCLWLYIAILGIVGLLHAAYARGRGAQLGFAIAIACAGTLLAMMFLPLFV